MRQQVEDRTEQTVRQHLMDGGYRRTDDLEQAYSQGVERFVPPQPAKKPENREHELDLKPGDSLKPDIIGNRSDWLRLFWCGPNQEPYVP